MVADEEKLKIYVKCAQLYLEEEDFVAAEGHVSRASLLVGKSTDKLICLTFKVKQMNIV